MIVNICEEYHYTPDQVLNFTIGQFKAISKGSEKLKEEHQERWKELIQAREDSLAKRRFEETKLIAKRVANAKQDQSYIREIELRTFQEEQLSKSLEKK